METNTLRQQTAAANERMQQLRESKEQLTLEVSTLMTHSGDEQLRWKGSVVDLMEALYCVFEQQTLTDEAGLPLPFLHIVRQCCQVLHVSMPRNPYQVATRGRNRKGIKSISFMRRYVRMRERGTGEKGLFSDISMALS